MAPVHAQDVMKTKDPRTQARIQISITGLLWAGLSALSFLHFHSPRRGWIFGGLATLFLVSALLIPPLAHVLHKVLSTVARGLVTVVSVTVLSIVFYLVLLPLGLILRGTGGLKTTRGVDPSLASYWVDRPSEPLAPARYLRPF